MSNQPHIKRLLSFLMIVVMIFSITPQRTVHEIFGCHDTTTVPAQSGSKKNHFNKDGFHCSCENQAFQTTFIAGIAPQLHTPAPVMTGERAIEFSSVLSVADICSAYLRGPPALA
ncbi:MAG: hypothetical protein QM687_07555 [Ferruginibacter sp.]